MSKKKICFLIVSVAAFFAFAESLFIFPQMRALIIATFIFLIALLALNRIALKKIYIQKAPFKIGGKIRNVDYLIIGDMINAATVVPANKRFVQIKAPNRSLSASFEILRHTSSILDEDNGNVVICTAKKNKNKKTYSIFDTPFLYCLTIKKLGLGTLNKLATFPVLIKPISTIQLMLDLNKKWKETSCPNKQIVTFCSERNFNLSYYED